MCIAYQPRKNRKRRKKTSPPTPNTNRPTHTYTCTHACNVRKLVTEPEWTRVRPIKAEVYSLYHTLIIEIMWGVHVMYIHEYFRLCGWQVYVRICSYY